MSDPAVAAQRQQQRQQGLIAGLVTLPFRFFGVLCGALLLCILIECVGMHFFWPEQGWRHAQGMLHYELDQLSTHFTRSALVQAAYRSRFGHPAPEVVQRYRERGVKVIDSARCGAARWHSERPGQVLCERQENPRYWQHRMAP